MRAQQINGYISGIRDEFILEAEPRALAALLPAKAEPAVFLHTLGENPPPRRKKRWLPLVIAAAIALTVGLNIGLYSGFMALTDPNYGFIPMAPSAPGGNPFGDLFGSLFPFLSPDETETQTENDAVTEEPEEETTAEYDCSEGRHKLQKMSTTAATCYCVGMDNYLCRLCGWSESVPNGEEMIPHEYFNMNCKVCGLMMGAHSQDLCTFTHESGWGYTLTELRGNVGSTLTLPNVYYTEAYDLRPVTQVGPGLLLGREGFTTLMLPSGTTYIAQDAMRGCSSLKTIIWPTNLLTVGDSAFMDCTSLTKVRVPSSVTTMTAHTFRNCTSLTEATLPSDLTKMGPGTFAGCTSLTDVTLPANLRELGGMTFDGCTSLETVSLPNRLQLINVGDFAHCTALREIDIPDTVQDVCNGAFEGCTALTRVKLPKDLQTLSISVFRDCTSLTELELPDGLRTIETNACQNAGLVTLTIPATVTTIERDAFGECRDLREIRYGGTMDEWRALTYSVSLGMGDDHAYTVVCSDGTINVNPNP